MSRVNKPEENQVLSLFNNPEVQISERLELGDMRSPILSPLYSFLVEAKTYGEDIQANSLLSDICVWRSVLTISTRVLTPRRQGKAQSPKCNNLLQTSGYQKLKKSKTLSIATCKKEGYCNFPPWGMYFLYYCAYLCIYM